jgi:hypothetical protein
MTDIVEPPQEFDEPMNQDEEVIKPDAQDTRSESRKSLIDLEVESISQLNRNVIEVNRKMLSMGKTSKTNPIATNNVFDTVGTNGIF